METLKVLKSRHNDKFVKVDVNSGYPMKVTYPWRATDWSNHSEVEIARYIKSFPEYHLVEVEIDFCIIKNFEVTATEYSLTEV